MAPPPPPQIPQITPYRQLPPSKRSCCLTACMIKSGTPLELRSGPKKFKVTLPEPVPIHSDPGLSRPINCIYGPELNLNSTFLIIWPFTPLKIKKREFQASKHGQIVAEVKKGKASGACCGFSEFNKNFSINPVLTFFFQHSKSCLNNWTLCR